MAGAETAGILGFGAYLPAKIVTNAQLAERLGCDESWILEMSGIRERRYAEESVADMALAAARNCLDRNPCSVGMLLMSSGSAGRRFPGPAAEVANRLGLAGIPAIDLPIASAGAVFAMSLAARLAPEYGNVLVVASEKMSSLIGDDRNTAILFGDGAGACLITNGDAGFRILDSVLHSDGAFSEDLRAEFGEPLFMNGRSVIMQAARKIPAVIEEVLRRNAKNPAGVDVFLMHQANQNLIDKVARSLSVETSRFYSNIAKRGNTSSASMLIAASEWWGSEAELICFSAFGAGFHWGGLLAAKSSG